MKTPLIDGITKEAIDDSVVGQVSLHKLLRDPNITREQYIQAGIEDENRGYTRNKKKLSLLTPLAWTRQALEPEEMRKKRFGRAFDKFRSGKSRARSERELALHERVIS